MPPNPERQARLAARREIMANDPKLRDAMESANAAVLGNAKPADEAAPAPRQMLPSYYDRGGKVQYSKGCKMISSKNC